MAVQIWRMLLADVPSVAVRFLPYATMSALAYAEDKELRHTTGARLLWTSRRDDDAEALILFGDRVREQTFQIKIDRESLVGERRDELLKLAEHIGIDMLVGG